MFRTLELRRVADGVAQACVLYAVVALPLYFTALTPTGYEPDKADLLRVVAIIAAAAWILGTQRRSLPFRTMPLLWLGAAFFVAYCVATITSIDLKVSIWGSFTRQQGLWT